jgi:hypothetical protein
MFTKHRRSFFAAGLVLAALLIVILVSHTNAVGAGLGAKTNIAVLCSSCGIPGADSTPHLIILDQDTGNVWAYTQLNQKPINMGKLQPGMPTQK